MSRPNILFILSDQQRWDTVSCYGQEPGNGLRLTPNIDSLAEKGSLFSHAFSAQPVCGPARACLQTGRWPTELLCHVNDRMLPADQPCIADYFHKAGYETAYVGKWHLASQYAYAKNDPRTVDFQTKPIPPQLRGGYRDYWVVSDVLEYTSHGYGGFMFDKDMNKRSFEGYRVDATTDFALEYLKQPKEKPFFLFLSYIEPHHQNDRNHYEGPNGSKDRYARYIPPGDLRDSGGDWQEEFPDYLGCCASLDENVGRLICCLKEEGLYENTVILYTSDHGSHFKTRNAEYKRSCHDSSIHIPLVISGPGFYGGGTVENLVSTIDMAPTLLHAAGIRPPDFMRGQPVQVKAGRELSEEEAVFIQISESCIGRALRTRRWTYCVEAPVGSTCANAPHSDRYRETCLYDNEQDPDQLNNRIDNPAYRDMREALRAKLLDRIFEAERLKPEIL